MADVINLREPEPLSAQLQDDICEVLKREKYNDLRIYQIVGVLEFLKFNLINRSE